MQQVSPEFIAVAAGSIVSPQYRFSASWLRQSIFGAYFTIGVSHIGLGDVIKGEGNNPAESNSYVFTDETPYVISLDIDRQLVEPAYSISQALADIVLDNTSDRFTPNFDPVIGGLIVPQRPVRINTGFLVSGIQQMVQSFTGQISDYPSVDSQNRQVTIHAIDYSQIIQNVSLVNAILQQNKTTGQIITFLFQLAGLAASQYQVDPGTITIPYAFFSPGQTIGDVITKIAECEGASVYLDENDVSRYETRNVWLDAPRTNRRHLRIDITSSPGGDLYWQPPFAPVSASTLYWCSVRYRTNIAGSQLVAEFFDGTSYTTSVMVGYLVASGAPVGTWRTVTSSVTTPAGCISMRFYINVLSPGYMETDDYYITLIQGNTAGSLIPNFSSELGTPNPNLITNGDFETDVSGWTTYLHGADAPPTISKDTSVFFNGLASAKIATSGTVTGYQGLTQTITGLTIGTQYNITLGVYTPPSTGSNIEIAFGSTGTSTTISNGWTQFSFTVIASSTSIAVRVGCSNSNAVINVDSVIVTSGNGGTPTGWGMVHTGGGQTFYWANRGQSDISLLLTDDLVKNDEQYNPQQNTIINSVTVTANPRKPVGAAVVMFSLAVNDSRLVPAGSTASVLCGYVDAQNIPLPFISLTTPTAGGANSFWVANSAANGSGTDQTSNLTLSSFTNYSTNSVALFSNVTGADIYITQLQVKGISVPITQQIVTTVKDATSIAQYGEQVYPINNDYIQTYAQAQQIASNLIADRKDKAIYRIFTIVGQPQLQLGDRIRRNSIDYFILRIKQSQNASSGLVQEIWAVSRPAYP